MRPDRSLWRPLAVGLAAMALAAGCGVSPTTRPTRVGDGLAADARVPEQQPPGPDDVGPGGGPDLVANYLGAAVAGRDFVQNYLTPAARSTWRPQGDSPTVVHVIRTEVATQEERRHSFRVWYQEIGQLTPNGSLQPAANRTLQNFTFSSDLGENRWRLSSVPNDLLLSDEALGKYYRGRPIYFWDKHQRTLVPDLRYLPNTKSPDLRADQVMDWLIGGPAPVLSPVVEQLQGIERSGHISTNDGTWVVNLSGAAANLDLSVLQRLTVQLRWSFYGLGPSNDVELTVENQPRRDVDGKSDDYQTLNATANLQGHRERYGVANGRLVNLDPPAQPAPHLGAENRQVISAAMSADGSRVAVVRDRQLVIARQGAKAVTYPLPFGPASRPAWLPGTEIVLLAVDGKLRAYGPKGVVAVNATLPGGDVTAFAIAPDGRRIAFVAGGRAYVTSLLDGPAITVGGSSGWAPLATSLLTSTAVAWTGEADVLVAGARGGVPAFSLVSADGAIEKEQPLQASDAIADVVALPRNPVSDPVADVAPTVIFVLAGGQAVDYIGGPPGSISTPLKVGDQLVTSACYAY